MYPGLGQECGEPDLFGLSFEKYIEAQWLAYSPEIAMNQHERLQLLMGALRSKGAFSREDMLRRCEISEPTFKRDLEFLRSRFGAEIVYDRFEKLYKLHSSNNPQGKYAAGERIEIANLWFGPDELRALLSMYALLEGVGADDLLGSHLSPFKARIEEMLGDGPKEADRIRQCIRILPMAARRASPFFVQIAQLTLQGRRFEMAYHSRQRAQTDRRTVSPQRLVHYRDNWYLDAYCHKREQVLTFSLDAIEAVEPSKEKAKSIPAKKLDEVLAGGYGIFNGPIVGTAVLRFSAEVSAWVCKERWHPEQVGEWVPQAKAGPKAWQLSFPYSHPRELVMDILRWGHNVKVVSPPELAKAVGDAHQQAAALYNPKA